MNQNINGFVHEAQLLVTETELKNACAWFYARFLMEAPETDMLSQANTLLVPRKYKLLTPQGPREEALLQQKGVQKKMLFKGQIYDIVERYADHYRLNESYAPPEVIKRLNATIDQFVETAADKMTNNVSSLLLRGVAVEYLALGMTAIFRVEEEKFQKRIADQYEKVAWYLYLQTYEKGERFLFQAEETENTCERCEAPHLKAYTLDEIVELDLLPPLHPNCRCRLTWLPEALSIEMTGDPQKGLSGIDRAKENKRTYERPNNFEYNLTHWDEEVRETIRSFQQVQQSRKEAGDWANYWTVGLVERFEQLKAKAELTGKPFDKLNMIMLGLPEDTARMIVGAIFPERPGSFAHIMDIIGTGSLVYGGVKGIKSLRAGKVSGISGAGFLDDGLDLTDDAVRRGVTGALDNVDDVARYSPKSGVGIVDDVVKGGSGTKGDQIVFGSDTKSATKLNNQMTKRGWTENTVRDTVNQPYTTRVSTNKATGNPATVYYNKSGGYVIIDDVTNAIVQVSDNINPSTWAPDPSIVDPYLPDTPK
ncbi:colicin E5-related ribonuclease [Fumia xinanensis]|uniref:colicin E5-related ribonuclease n=1 Tax=Fumia xinanensis TaxID=2763659 RepID=UPI002016651B|nr:colicin E5-related ribonuclease [Fumia xinanensis]